MQVKVELLSDTILGSGVSIPGGEDTSVICDEWGFPYIKGSAFYGILKEETYNYLTWTEKESKAIQEIKRLFEGNSSTEYKEQEDDKITVSDFELSLKVKENVLESVRKYWENPENEELIRQKILKSMTGIRAFTALEDGMAKKGSLRSTRYISQGLIFFGNIKCQEKDEILIKQVLKCVKRIGTMRNRGFGNVQVTVR